MRTNRPWVAGLGIMIMLGWSQGEAWALGNVPTDASAAQRHLGAGGIPGTKWHPGNFILLPMNVGEPVVNKVMSTLRNSPNFVGLQKRYTWKSLEPTPGVYDFSEIRSDLRRLTGMGKRLVVQVQYKSFKADENYAPAYLQSDEFGGGIFRMERGGANLKLWKDNVRDRIASLYAALGKALDGEPNLEAVVIPETSPGEKSDLQGIGYDEDRYVENLVSSAQTLRRAFPHTVTLLYANYPIRALPRFVEAMSATGLGLGGPDTFTNSASMNRGVYREYDRLAGVVPLAVAVQAENYTAREHRGAQDRVPVMELYDFARNTLHVNYLFWVWQRAPEDYFGNVERMMFSVSGRYGGLEGACPKLIAPCLE